jgi:hypothetical protein
MFRIPQIVLLAAILAGLTHAQTSPKESPADWAVDSDAQRVAVIDKLNSRKNLTRVIRVDYHVASTDRRQDQMMALFLGAPNEDAAQIDAVVYRGLVYGKPLRMQYFIVEFYAGDRLIAKRGCLQRERDSHLRTGAGAVSERKSRTINPAFVY